MPRLLIPLLLTLSVGCSPAGRPPEVTRQAPPTAGDALVQPPPEASPATAKAGPVPTPALVLIGLAVGAALVVALISNAAMMPDTAP